MMQVCIIHICIKPPVAETERKEYFLDLWSSSRVFVCLEAGEIKPEITPPWDLKSRPKKEKKKVMQDHVGSGLMVGRKNGKAPAVEVKNGKLRPFAICGDGPTSPEGSVVANEST